MGSETHLKISIFLLSLFRLRNYKIFLLDQRRNHYKSLYDIGLKFLKKIILVNFLCQGRFQNKKFCSKPIISKKEPYGNIKLREGKKILNNSLISRIRNKIENFLEKCKLIYFFISYSSFYVCEEIFLFMKILFNPKNPAT